MSVSPRNTRDAAAFPAVNSLAYPPVACTAAETAAVRLLLRSMRPRPLVVAVGTSADGLSTLNAVTVRTMWLHEGGIAQGIVVWPDTAESWLPPALRYTDLAPDAWIATGTLPGWIGMAAELARSTAWDPRRTVALSGLAHPAELGAAGIFTGLHGTRSDGSTWTISPATPRYCRSS